jgi:hypothetical protein
MKIKIKVAKKELHAKHDKYIQDVSAYYLWPIPKLGLIIIYMICIIWFKDHLLLELGFYTCDEL